MSLKFREHVFENIKALTYYNKIYFRITQNVFEQFIYIVSYTV